MLLNNIYSVAYVSYLILGGRLNPRHPRPKWYVPVDVDEDKLRWS